MILLRHGESRGNARNVFTGWIDAPLTARGGQQALDAGHSLRAHRLRPTVAHTSALTRAARTCSLALAAAGCREATTTRTWRLNERHYGALQGREKRAVREEYGKERYRRWRRSLHAAPPPLPAAEAAAYTDDPRYGGVPASALPRSESLHDVRARLLPYWHSAVAPDLRSGHTVLVVAHSNSLRALVSHLDRLSPRQIEELNIPTGLPLRYDLDERLLPTVPGGRYLDPANAATAVEAVAEQGL